MSKEKKTLLVTMQAADRPTWYRAGKILLVDLWISQIFTLECQSVAGVVVSCKIPILATRVRFPGDANLFFPSLVVEQDLS